jgi:hypothetical protein
MITRMSAARAAAAILLPLRVSLGTTAIGAGGTDGVDISDTDEARLAVALSVCETISLDDDKILVFRVVLEGGLGVGGTVTKSVSVTTTTPSAIFVTVRGDYYSILQVMR